MSYTGFEGAKHQKFSTRGTQYVLQMVSNHDFWLVANRLSRDELSNCLSNCRDQGGNILNFKKSNRSTDSSTDRFEMRGHLNAAFINESFSVKFVFKS